MSRMDGKKTHTHTRPQKQYETKNKTTSCPTHVLVDVYATGSGRRDVDQRVNRRLCVQKILVLSVEPRGEVIADVLRCDLGDVLVRRNGAVVRLQEHHHFHPVRSGRSPPLYCTLTLLAMQGHQKRKEKKRKEKMLFFTFSVLVANPKKLLYTMSGYKMPRRMTSRKRRHVLKLE